MIPLVIKYVEYHFKTHSTLMLNDISKFERTVPTSFFLATQCQTIFCTLEKNPLVIQMFHTGETYFKLKIMTTTGELKFYIKGNRFTFRTRITKLLSSSRSVVKRKGGAAQCQICPCHEMCHWHQIN